MIGITVKAGYTGTNRYITIPVNDAEYSFAQSFTVGKQHENIRLVTQLKQKDALVAVRTTQL